MGLEFYDVDSYLLFSKMANDVLKKWNNDSLLLSEVVECEAAKDIISTNMEIQSRVNNIGKFYLEHEKDAGIEYLR